MQKFLVLFLVVVLSSCVERKIVNQVKFDQKAESDIMFGYTNLDGFKKTPFNTWFQAEYNSYLPDIETLNQIDRKNFNKEFKIVVVMGSWCSDSKREVPRWIKILETIGYPMNSVEIINVDTQKHAEGTIVGNLSIEKIPTFIITKKKNEVGRIIESPEISLEKDLVKIIPK